MLHIIVFIIGAIVAYLTGRHDGYSQRVNEECGVLGRLMRGQIGGIDYGSSQQAVFNKVGAAQPVEQNQMSANPTALGGDGKGD